MMKKNTPIPMPFTQEDFIPSLRVFSLLTSYIAVSFFWVPNACVLRTDDMTSSASVPPSAVCSSISRRYSLMNLFIPQPAPAIQGTAGGVSEDAAERGGETH